MINRIHNLVGILVKDRFNNIKHFTNYIIKIKFGDSDLVYTFLDTHYSEFLQTKSISQIKEVLDILDDYYYNKESIIKDSTYDIISEYYYDNSKTRKHDKIGHEIIKNKVKLPIHLGSMDKLKLGDKALVRFLTKYTNSKVVSSKLDGVSMLIGKQNNILKAFTRGNGVYGCDITYILKYIKYNGKSLYEILHNLPNNDYIRGELIMSKLNWENNQHIGSNARNVISGIVNSKTLHYNKLALCEFLGYEYITSNVLKIVDQFNTIISLGLKTPIFKLYPNSQLSIATLPDILKTFKLNAGYEIDGLIIQDNDIYTRNVSGNPTYAKAFKMEIYNESGVSKIHNIFWGKTKSGYLKPTLEIEPIQLKDVVIKRVYAYNALYLKTHNLGIGSVIEVIRSGDVIPKIKSIISAKFNITSDFPQIPYQWNSTSVDIQIKGEDSEVTIRQIEYFMKSIDVSFIKIGIIKKLYNQGFKNITDFINVTSADELLVEGIKEKSATKIFKSIKEGLTMCSLDIFGAALPCFKALGKKKMKKLTDQEPKFYEIESSILKDRILNIKGFSDKSANCIIDGMSEFKTYMETYNNIYTAFKIHESVIISNNENLKFSKRIFCFSGIRDKELETQLILNGGIIDTAFSNAVTDLIVKDIHIKSNKVLKALAKNITITSIYELKTLDLFKT